ncbi:thioredoxin family protein [Pseudobacteriovorax antillogorgiicola]|uniref:Redoxin n=1 Tax=Pseudobacteriovorax antillogorgiicola TaxID=1513793 RepID=A0A1Y6CVL6_9BACT|nr:thioredoxin family protein [Pseudobacteriovorax antillogorgiicola]TCS42753.1 redoxin [Pseudobacteriovorax antillogorgiicola]SMF82252.1 Redoxin [Pseudobacteriovorax antillogorgiicola]
MALTESLDLEPGTMPPAFALPDTDGSLVTLDQFKDNPILVVSFICNHCPFVKHIADPLAALARDYQKKGIAFVAISSNDVANYPEDSPEKMAEEKTLRGYTFPYLYDESQAVAKAYRAVCTPDIFVFVRNQGLAYHGQFDNSRPSQGKATGEDLSRALDSLLENPSTTLSMKPSVGCNIKWKD